MAKTAALSFRVDPALKQGLEIAAQADRRSVSSLIEKILAEWLQAQPSAATGTKSCGSGSGGSSKPQRQSVATEKPATRKPPRAKAAAMSKEAQLRALRERGTAQG